MHGVRRVTEGLRYTSPSWYSADPLREDPFSYSRVTGGFTP
jgi:hypothetical protein